MFNVLTEGTGQLFLFIFTYFRAGLLCGIYASAGPILHPPHVTDESILRNYGMIIGR
jgi:hypothetical protein